MERRRAVTGAYGCCANPSEVVAIFAIAIEAEEAPEWIELIPAGKFSAVDGRGPFDNQNPDSIVAASVANMPQVGLVLDYDHATDLAAPEGRPAPAAGWLKGFKVEHGAIFARIEWTADAAEAVKSKKYRYVSPVFEHSKDGKVERILRAALTNNPALINLRALAHASTLSLDPSPATERARGLKDLPLSGGGGAKPQRGALNVSTMAKKDDKPKLSEVMATLEAAYPEAHPRKLMDAAACLMAEDDDDDGDDGGVPDDEEGDGTEPAAADPYGSESEEQMATRQADEMAKCANDDEKAACASKHEREKEAMSKRVKMYQQHRGLEQKAKETGGKPNEVSPAISSLIDRHVAKHPMMLAAQTEISKLRAERNREQATAAVDKAIREGRLIPSQREWAIEYCGADEKGFEKFIGAQPKIIHSGVDNTFLARIGDAPKGASVFNDKQREIFANLGLESDEQLEKCAAVQQKWTLKFPRPRLFLDDSNSGQAGEAAQ